MKRFLPFSLLIILTIAVMLFAACSDDKGTGSGDEPDYAAMKADIEEYMPTIMASIIFGFDQFDELDTGFIPNGGGLGKLVPFYKPADTTYYNYANGWHEFIMELSFTSGDTTAELTINDSVQYKADDVAMQFPDETTDFLHFIFLLDLMYDNGVENVDVYYHVDNQYQKLPTEDIQVDGVIDFDLAGDSANLHGELSYDITVDELVVNGVDGCPQSGTIIADVEVEYDGPDASLNGSWTVTITFLDSDTWRIRLEIGDNYWQGEEDFDCSDFYVDLE